MKAKAEFIGRVTKDPETKTIGKSNLCTFSLASNRKNKDGETEATFFNLEAWGQGGEYIAKYAKRGDLVALDADIRIDKWQGEDGKPREKTKYVVVPYTFMFMGGGSKDAPAGSVGDADADNDNPF